MALGQHAWKKKDSRKSDDEEVCDFDQASFLWLLLWLLSLWSQDGKSLCLRNSKAIAAFLEFANWLMLHGCETSEYECLLFCCPARCFNDGFQGRTAINEGGPATSAEFDGPEWMTRRWTKELVSFWVLSWRWERIIRQWRKKEKQKGQKYYYRI